MREYGYDDPVRCRNSAWWLLKSNMKYFRKIREMTQRDLAKMSGLSFSMISKIENGEQVNPSLGSLDMIAGGLEVDVSELFEFREFESGDSCDH